MVIPVSVTQFLLLGLEAQNGQEATSLRVSQAPGSSLGLPSGCHHPQLPGLLPQSLPSLLPQTSRPLPSDSLPDPPNPPLSDPNTCSLHPPGPPPLDLQVPPLSAPPPSDLQPLSPRPKSARPSPTPLLSLGPGIWGPGLADPPVAATQTLSAPSKAPSPGLTSGTAGPCSGAQQSRVEFWGAWGGLLYSTCPPPLRGAGGAGSGTPPSCPVLLISAPQGLRTHRPNFLGPWAVPARSPARSLLWVLEEESGRAWGALGGRTLMGGQSGLRAFLPLLGTSLHPGF